MERNGNGMEMEWKCGMEMGWKWNGNGMEMDWKSNGNGMVGWCDGVMV